MPLFSKTDDAVDTMVAEVMEEYHPKLHAEGVTVGTLFAFGGDDAIPVLKHHGWPAAAVVKINSLKDRVRGLADATITIDKATWNEYPDATRRALIDHELEHLQLVMVKDTMFVQHDDHDRPKLKIKPHDFELGVFKSTRRGRARFPGRHDRQ
jgi:hypothetical protein